MCKLRESVTISLTKELKEKLDKVAKHEKANRSDIVKAALKQYLSILEFREIRNRMLLKAEISGIYNEEDIYKIVS